MPGSAPIKTPENTGPDNHEKLAYQLHHSGNVTPMVKPINLNLKFQPFRSMNLRRKKQVYKALDLLFLAFFLTLFILQLLKQ